MLEHNKSLKELTTIKIGGIAKIVATPENTEELKSFLKTTKNTEEIFVLGRGSNTIMGDFDGIVIRTSKLKDLSIKEKDTSVFIYAQAGVSLMTLTKIALELNLEGLYRLDGFPASVGGAVAMNAGAFGSEFSHFINYVDFIDWEGSLHRVDVKELKFSYRSSPFPELGIVLGAGLELKKSDKSVLEEYLNLKKKRHFSQPRGVLTSGSTFKNPPGDFAGRLLEMNGLKGFKLGNLGFSNVHANFLINFGNATFNEAVEIISLARERVFSGSGIILEEEVKLVASGSNSRRRLT
ncbi:MAG: UDP-N-acetylmuramate dehydrogenase [Aquificaceae bacterium]